MQVDFEQLYPIEGAKEVGTLMTRYVSRALRAWSSQQAARKQLAVAGAEKPKKKGGGLNDKIVNTWKKVKGMGKGKREVNGGQHAPQEDEKLPIVHLVVGKDALGNAQVVAQTRLQAEQCVAG